MMHDNNAIYLHASLFSRENTVTDTEREKRSDADPATGTATDTGTGTGDRLVTMGDVKRSTEE